MIDEIDGVGWITADKIGRAVGIDHRAPERLRAGILHALRTAEDDGHTCVPRAALLTSAGAHLQLAAADVAPRLGELVESEELVSYSDRVYRVETYEAEAGIASTVASLLVPSPEPEPSEVETGKPPEPEEERESRPSFPRESPRRGPRDPVESWALAGLRQLAADDPDRARVRNGLGFNKADGAAGRRLAESADAEGLTDEQWVTAVSLARKYQRQIGRPPALREEVVP